MDLKLQAHLKLRTVSQWKAQGHTELAGSPWLTCLQSGWWSWWASPPHKAAAAESNPDPAAALGDVPTPGTGVPPPWLPAPSSFSEAAWSCARGAGAAILTLSVVNAEQRRPLHTVQKPSSAPWDSAQCQTQGLGCSALHTTPNGTSTLGTSHVT